MRSTLFASIATITAFFFACGSSSDDAPAKNEADAGGGAGDVASLCTSMCDWKTRCGTAPPTCAQDCNRDTAQYQGKWSASYIGGVSSCFTTLACDKKGDACTRDFASGYETVVRACLTKHEECTVPGAGPDGGTITASTFSDEYCESLPALTDAARASADACRAKTCAAVGDCLKAAGAFTF